MQVEKIDKMSMSLSSSPLDKINIFCKIIIDNKEDIKLHNLNNLIFSLSSFLALT